MSCKCAYLVSKIPLDSILWFKGGDGLMMHAIFIVNILHTYYADVLYGILHRWLYITGFAHSNITCHHILYSTYIIYIYSM